MAYDKIKAWLLVHRKVALRGLNLTGEVINVRDDGLGEAIYTVELDNPNHTTDGLFVARLCELELL
jgi:hypothetical protein